MTDLQLGSVPKAVMAKMELPDAARKKSRAFCRIWQSKLMCTADKALKVVFSFDSKRATKIIARKN